MQLYVLMTARQSFVTARLQLGEVFKLKRGKRTRKLYGVMEKDAFLCSTPHTIHYTETQNPTSFSPSTNK